MQRSQQLTDLFSQVIHTITPSGLAQFEDVLSSPDARKGFFSAPAQEVLDFLKGLVNSGGKGRDLFTEAIADSGVLWDFVHAFPRETFCLIEKLETAQQARILATPGALTIFSYNGLAAKTAGILKKFTPEQFAAATANPEDSLALSTNGYAANAKPSREAAFS